MKWTQGWSLVLLVTCIAGPAAAAPQPRSVIHLPGIAGPTVFDHRFVRALVAGDPAHHAFVLDWTQGESGLAALFAYNTNLRRSARLARLLTDRRAQWPDERVILIGHSGGAAMALWALERMPEEVQIDTLILLLPAISPRYDLSKALRRVERAIVFSSLQDYLVLGAGTVVFGTLDRVHTPAAGMVGFVPPEGADAVQYAKLVAMPYQPQWLLTGFAGDHMSILSPRFAREVLEPLLDRTEPRSD